MTKRKDGKAYQIKVALKYSRPPIWRRLVVRGDMSLFELHRAIQAAMGWYDEHLHQFVLRTRPGSGRPDPKKLAENMQRYGYLKNLEDIYGERRYSLPDFELEDVHDERKVRFDEVAGRKGAKLIYEYDFGDYWEHEIVIEKVLDLDPAGEYPRCLAGRRAGPPEDCGGVWGYAELIEAMADPKHERHEEYKEWLGDDPESPFDPEHFDVEEVNARLRKIFSSGRKKA